MPVVVVVAIVVPPMFPPLVAFVMLALVSSILTPMIVAALGGIPAVIGTRTATIGLRESPKAEEQNSHKNQY